MAFAEAAQFWTYVESDTEPPVDSSDATRRALSQRYIDKTTDAVELGFELACHVTDYLDAQAAEKAAKSQKTLAQNRIQLLMREHEMGLVDGVPFVSIKTTHRGGYEVAPADYSRLTVLKGARQ
jgi:predicted phage-related endonuclease